MLIHALLTCAHTIREVKEITGCQSYISNESFLRKEEIIIFWKFFTDYNQFDYFMSVSFFHSVCLPVACVCICVHAWFLILSHSFNNHCHNAIMTSWQAYWVNGSRFVTFDDSKTELLLFIRCFQILRSHADLAYLDWARRGEPSHCQEVLLHDPICQQPHPPPGEWESCPWEWLGGPSWNSHSTWVEIRVPLKGWEALH